MRLGIFCILVLAGLGSHSPARSQDAITVVLSEDSGVYAEFASQLGQALGKAGNTKTALRVVALGDLKDEPAARTGPNQILVAVGTPAMTAMARKPPAVPVLNVLVPHASFRSLSRSSARTQDNRLFSAVFFDQPWARQLSLIRNAIPGRRVGVLLGRDSAELASSLQAAARDAHMVLNIERVFDEAELLPALKRLLPNSDALLAVPDATIYNRTNIASILLTSYRAKVPLFAVFAILCESWRAGGGVQPAGADRAAGGRNHPEAARQRWSAVAPVTALFFHCGQRPGAPLTGFERGR